MGRVQRTIQVKPGVGGREPADFAQMLRQMYARRAERHGLTVAVEGETLTFSGDADYDIGREEKGIHRLVRVSPFDPENRRHTSFARVTVNGQSDDYQVRSYIFHPYQRVRNHLPEWERPDVDVFMRGDVEGPPDEPPAVAAVRRNDE